jgi:histidyl-tRNA synthetase
MPAQALPGFRDFFPEDAVFRQRIFAVWREVCARYGFEEYDGPPLEPLDLYTKKSGEEIVEQLYAFNDKAGRAVALRPEMTPTLARMVSQRVRALKKPIRWFSIPQLFRYERQQRGRLREHFQLNMDLIGEDGALADAEIIAAAIDIARGLGLTEADVRARVSDRRVAHALLAAQGLDEVQIAAAYQHIDKLERESRESLRRSLAKATALSDSAAEAALAIGDLKGLDAVRDALGAAGAEGAGEDLGECVRALGAMGLAEFVDVELCIVRGLAYYTGIVFELFDARRELRAICGGGRYDGLLAALGGEDLPAVGFGMGDVVLGELLNTRNLAATDRSGADIFVVGVTAEDTSYVLGLVHILRDAGCRVEFALRPQSVGKQFKLAGARGAHQAVVLGPDERAAGEALLRDLVSGAERRVALNRLVDALRQ